MLSPPKRPFLNRGDLLALLVLAFLTVLFFLPLLGADKAWCEWDFSGQFIPLYHWMHLKYAAGQSPLWSDQLQSGYPILDESLSGYFYWPRHLIMKYLDAFPAIRLDVTLHTYFAGLGAYLYCRIRQMESAPCLLAAIVTSFGGGMTFAQHAIAITTDLAWLPWQFLAVEVSLKPGKELAGAALLGLATGMSATGGYATFILLNGSLTLLYALARAYSQKAKAGRVLWIAALALSLTTLMSWGYFRSALRGMAESTRNQSFSLQAASVDSLAPSSLIHLILPYAFGDPRDSSFLGMNWPGGTWIHQGLFLYISLAALFLASYGIWRRKEPRLLVALSALLLLVALGTATPLFSLVHALPGFDHIRAPGKWVIAASFPMAVAAGWGLESLLESPQATRSWSYIALGFSGLLAALYLDSHLQGEYWIGLGMEWMHRRLGARADLAELLSLWQQGLEALKRCLQAHLEFQTIFMAATAGLFYLGALPERKRLLSLLWISICVADLLVNVFAYFPITSSKIYTDLPPTLSYLNDREPDHGAFRFFDWGESDLIAAEENSGWYPGAPERESIGLELVPGDMPVFSDFSSLRSYTSLVLNRSAFLLNGLRESSPFLPGQREALLLSRRNLFDRGAARYFFSAVPLRQDGLKFLSKTKYVSIYLNEHAKALAWPASEVLRTSNAESATAAVLAEPWNSTHSFVESGRVGASDSSAKLSWHLRSDEAWEIEVQAKRDSFVVLSRVPYRALYHAKLDGKEVPWQETDGASSGVWVPAGDHLLRMEVSDPLLKRDLALDLFGFALALSLISLGFLKRRPTQTAI